MRLRWSNEGLKKPIKEAERPNESNWWALFIVLIVMVICFILKVMEM